MSVKHFSVSLPLVPLHSIILAVLGGSLLLGASSKVSLDMPTEGTPSQPSLTTVKVIIQYKQAPSSADLLSLAAIGGLLEKDLSSLNETLATVPVTAVASLANNPNVVYISPDRPLAQMLDYSAAAVGAKTAWNTGLTGKGIGVAVIDSGVREVADLTNLASVSRVIYRESFTGNSDLKDKYGHGTHVAGILGANGMESSCPNCTREFKGIAPDSKIVDLQVLDGTGAGTDSAVILAIDRAISLKKSLNIRVINLSLGRPVYESYQLDPLCQAVEAAWKAGITVVVAAGNDGRDNAIGNAGYGTIGSPANDPYVISVGAMKAMGTSSRTDDLIASYSSKGPAGIDFVVKPDLVAPGNHVVSLESANSLLAKDPATAVPLSYYQATTDNSTSPRFMMLNGTSMATPVVSGAVAVLLQSDPTLTPDQIKARLMKTAYKTFPESSVAIDDTTGQSFTSYYDIFTVGAGYLDLAAALANRDVATGTALSPTAAYNPLDGNVYLVFDPSSAWSHASVSLHDTPTLNAAWSVQNVWGPVVFPNRAVWGNGILWSNSETSGFRAVWGTRGVWGAETDQASSTLQGTRAVWGSDSKTSDSDKVSSSTPK